LPRSHHPGDSSESHVEVQNKFFPEAFGPSLVLSARLGLIKEKKMDKKEREHKLCFISRTYVSAEFQTYSNYLVLNCFWRHGLIYITHKYFISNNIMMPESV
jgi:hypothetical protein